MCVLPAGGVFYKFARKKNRILTLETKSNKNKSVQYKNCSYDLLHIFSSTVSV